MKPSGKTLRGVLLGGAMACVASLASGAAAVAQQAKDEPQVIAAASQQRHGSGQDRQHRDHARRDSHRDRSWDRRHSDWRDDWRRPDWRYSQRHRYHDHDYWRRGHWYHGWRDGRYSWWWGLGSDWYAYDVPVYPYPDPEAAPPPIYYDPNAIRPAPVPPPPVAAGNPPLVFDPYTGQYKPEGAAASYYYCYSPPGYYPNVTNCPSGWVARPPG